MVSGSIYAEFYLVLWFYGSRVLFGSMVLWFYGSDSGSGSDFDSDTGSDSDSAQDSSTPLTTR